LRIFCFHCKIFSSDKREKAMVARAFLFASLAVCLAGSQAKAGEAAGIPPRQITAPAPHCEPKPEREILSQARCACAKDAHDLAIHLERIEAALRAIAANTQATAGR
jgi:hypothetical protein